MNKTQQMIGAALAGAVLTATAMTAATAAPEWSGSEKCAGVVAKGKNDCGTSKHSCHAQATVDRDPEEWVYMPTGLCTKIAGGTVK